MKPEHPSYYKFEYDLDNDEECYAYDFDCHCQVYRRKRHFRWMVVLIVLASIVVACCGCYVFVRCDDKAKKRQELIKSSGAVAGVSGSAEYQDKIRN